MDNASIRNTADDNGLSGMMLLANALSGGSAEDFIYGQEAQGQREFVRSEQLPTESSNSDAEFEALGITFGPADPRDPLFRPATLPEGWKRQATDHSMGSNVVDQYGRARISVFYKAAFYDRKASMYIITPSGYLQGCLRNRTAPLLDDEWLTAESALDLLAKLAEQEQEEAAKADRYREEGRGDVEFWRGRAADHRRDAEQITAMADRIRDGAK